MSRAVSLRDARDVVAGGHGRWERLAEATHVQLDCAPAFLSTAGRLPELRAALSQAKEGDGGQILEDAVAGLQ